MANYVTELANQAFREIAASADPMFRAVTAGVGEKLVEVVGAASDASTIAAKLISRPDLQAHVASLTGYTPSRWILERELDQVNARRTNLGIDSVPETGGPYNRAADSGLIGLCFSGGGIRSATFNLGILQGLAELKLLRCFDYLSTVSGGGYIHQWFAAWTQRRGFEQVEQRLIPLPEPKNPGDHPEPIRWLRRYSNYLTPENGLFSGDTWVAIANWLRNTLLNQIILFSGLFFVALILRLLAWHYVAPKGGPAVFAFIGAIFYLMLQAAYLIGRNLFHFNRQTGLQGFGQGAVNIGIIFPLTLSALLITLLLPFVMAEMFGIYLTLIIAASIFLFLVLSLTVALAGHAPLCYLQTHHQTSQYKSVREFWSQPKCFVHLKFVLAIVGMCSLCVLAAFAGAASIGGSIVLLAKLYHITGHYWWRVVLVASPPLMLAGALVTMLMVVGLLGRMFDDDRREWLTRLAGCIGLVILLWILSFGFSLFGHHVLTWLWIKLWAGIPVLTAWIVASVGGLLAGKSAKSAGEQSDEASGLSAVELAAFIGPYVFIAGLLLLVSASAEAVFCKASTAGTYYLLASYLASLAICALFAWRVDINEFSLHAFYRNRLARCYLGASNIPRHPNRFTGFDQLDTNIPVSELQPDKGYHGPFPIFCTTLNLTFGEDLAWQERKGASFAFTPLYSGYDVPWTEARGRTNLRFNGFVETAKYAYPEPGLHLDTAAAISGAALSPNMGYHSNPATAFLMTVFDVRLGWWLRNPRTLDENGIKLGSEDRYPRPSPHFSLLYLAKELFGRTDDTSNYVYLSDGGHFDNMGLYELVRRRCRYVVICDSEADPDLTFEGIGMAIRKCRIDFGAEVDLDLRPLQHVGDSQNSSAHCVVGTITYPENPACKGIVVYIKSSLTGDEPADVLNYKKEDPVFPHDSTLDQWFSESQFESYRRLGHHVALSVFEPAGPGATNFACTTLPGREQYFENLHSIWWAPTPEIDRFAAAHTERYNKLLEKARTDKKLPGFFDMMFGTASDWKKDHSKEQIEYAVQFSSELIEFIFTVFNQLDLRLPEKRNHPYVRGWSPIFTKWAKIDVVQDGWKRYRGSYSPDFCRFAESDAESGMVKLPI